MKEFKHHLKQEKVVYNVLFRNFVLLFLIENYRQSLIT